MGEIATFQKKDSEFTPGCPNACLKHSHWIPFERGPHWYVEPCPIHRPTYQHPDDRPPEPKDPKAEAENKKRAREARSIVESENERADW